MWSQKSLGYKSLPDEETQPLHKHDSGYSFGRAFFLLLCCFAGVASFFTTRAVVNTLEKHEHSFPLELYEQTFVYNRSFSYPPSEETNQAWRSIFPKHGGFFVHPTVSPQMASFAGFHQLHCLNSLRGAYFANAHAAQNGHTLLNEDMPTDMQVSHMRHCIDLLRQTLMCHADTTIEVVDASVNGVHGFNTPHMCRNWEQLRDWTSAQQDHYSAELRKASEEDDERQ